MEKKTEFIGEIRTHLSNASAPRPKMKRTRTIGKLSPVGLILFVGAIVSAVLISSFFVVYYAEITGELELSGQEAPLFTFDNIGFTGDTCALPLNLPPMGPDDVISTHHVITNEDCGYYSVTFAYPDLNPSDPLDPFFGVYFSIENYTVDTVPVLPEELVIGPGMVAGFNYTFEVDHEFCDPGAPMPVSIVATIQPYIEIINATDDSFQIGTASGTLTVLANDDQGLFGVNISSIDTTGLDPSFTVSISADKQTLLFSQVQGPWSGQHFHYTIVDKASGLVFATAQVTITL